jgi:hypothetical protein
MAKPQITLKSSVAPNALTYQQLDDNFTNLQNATFTLKAGTGGPDIITDLNGTITLVAGTGITLNGNNTNKTITISGSGSGTVNTGAAGALAFYPSAGTTVDDATLFFSTETGTDVLSSDSLSPRNIKIQGAVTGRVILGRTTNQVTVPGELTTESTVSTLTLNTKLGSNTSSIAIAGTTAGGNANITLTPQGSGFVVATGGRVSTGANALTLNTNQGGTGTTAITLNNSGNIVLAPHTGNNVQANAQQFFINNSNAQVRGQGSISLQTNQNAAEIAIGTNGAGNLLLKSFSANETDRINLETTALELGPNTVLASGRVTVRPRGNNSIDITGISAVPGAGATVSVENGNNAAVRLVPVGTGRVFIGELGGTVTTAGGLIRIDTNNGVNTGKIEIDGGANPDGDITIAPHGDGTIVLDGDVDFRTGVISTTGTNTTIELEPSGTGTVWLNGPVEFNETTGSPSNLSIPVTWLKVQVGDGFIRTAKTVSATGTPTISTTVKQYGAGALSTSSGNYLTVSSSADFGYGTGDFTIEMWIYRTVSGATQFIYDQRTATPTNFAPLLFINTSNQLLFSDGSATQITGATTIPLNAWSHIAVSRSGTSTRLFLNGVQQGSTYTDTRNYIATPVRIGARFDGTSPFTGGIDDVRIIKGVAVYTANFTAPAAALPQPAGTVLKLPFDTNFDDDVTSSGNEFYIPLYQ